MRAFCSDYFLRALIESFVLMKQRIWLKAMIADCLASAAVEQVCDIVDNTVKEKAQRI